MSKGDLVLVVEDDEDIRYALTTILQINGYRVQSAGNGREALRQLRQGERPSLILLDLMLPVLSGWRFRQEQLRDPSLAPIRVVVVSAAPDLPQVAASLGAADYLAKPVEPQALVETVRRLCPGRCRAG
jgi:two-component system, chemotaxis family, chemotaxis protein CheY